ncbi:hypothetical protein FRC09_008462 [Ceratobasidium sp. 395]|nr:hypothetical protein FRC09_008462 [Ceratobasidium sp. 395]
MLDRIKNRIHRAKEKSRLLLRGGESTSAVDQAPSISSQELAHPDPPPARPPPTAELPDPEHRRIDFSPAVFTPTNIESITPSTPEPAEANVASIYTSTAAPPVLHATNQSNTNLTTTPDLQTRKARDGKNTAWSGLNTLLDVLNQSTNAFPPLKSAFNGFLQCIDIFENAVAAREEYTQLRIELDSIFSDISGFLNGNAPPSMTPSIASLARGIEAETQRVAHKLRRNKMEQYAEATEDAHEVLECYRRIQALLNRLSLNANMNMWRTMDEHATQNRLDRLPQSAEAKYRSAQSDSLGRNGCTPNTRVDVLEQLVAWAQEDKNEKIYWLNGMAGTGKTTIAYSLCEQLHGAGKLAASFFCSRQLPSCRDVNRILPSIAYQLSSFSRPFRHQVSDALEGFSDAHNQPVDLQFNTLIADPLRTVRKTLPANLVIVIDALDECEDVGGVGKMLFALLQQASDLPMKVVVTSRPEPLILDKLDNETHKHARSELRLHELERSSVQSDINTYLTTELRDFDLSAAELDKLTNRSGILFVYASTLVRYVTYDTARRSRRMKEILSTPLALDSSSQGVDTLYTTILLAALDDKNLSREEKKEMRQILNTVICAQEPLSVELIAQLLGISDVEAVYAALRPLSSVLQVSNTADQLVTTLHQSFPDYMLDQNRSQRFYCEPQRCNAWYAKACFDLIKSASPSFNICRLESSYVPDRNVLDLEDRINEIISPQLFYACRFWEAHAELAEPATELVDQVLIFLSTRLLLWMEMMSLKQDISAGVGMLLRLQAWLRFMRVSNDMQELAVDALRFLTAYASGPISQHTPHIYLSTLALWPKQRPISTLYSERFPYITQASGTAMDRRGATALAVLNAAGAVLSVACSPDGTRIASGSSGHTVQIWDAYTGRMIGQPLRGHTGEVLCVAFSPDNERIVSGSRDNTIRIWDSSTGQTLGQALRGHTDDVNSVAYSPDGLCIVSGSSDWTVRIWDARTGQGLGDPLEGHTDSVLSVAYSSDSAYIVSGSEDCTVRIWDAKTRTQLSEPIEGHEDYYVGSVAFSPNGSCVVSGSADRSIRIWDAKTRQALGQPLEGHTGFVLSVTYSPNGAYIASSSRDQTIRIWDASTGDMMGQPLRGHTASVRSVAYSPDGLRIISGSQDETIRIWDAHIGQTLGQPPQGHTGAVYSVAYSPDGACIASGSRDDNICIWDAFTGQMVGQPLKGHTRGVHSVAYSHDGKRIVSGSDDRTVRIWDTCSGQMVGQPLVGHTDTVWSVVFSPDGSRVSSGSEDNTIRIWDAHTGMMVGQPLKGYTGPIYSVTFSPDGSHITSGSEHSTICKWDANTGQIVAQPLTGQSYTVLSVAYSPSGNHIVSGSGDNTIRIWDARTGQMVGQPLEHPTGSVWSVAYSPDGTRIVSGSDDKTIRVWDAHTGQMIGQPLEGHTDRVWSIAYSPDGEHIVSGSWDKSIRIWDVCALSNPGEAFQDNSGSVCQRSSAGETPARIPGDFNPQSSVYEPTQRGFPVRPNPSDTKAWTLSEDGWVVGHNLKPLLWVPPELRFTLLRQGMSTIISTEGSWSLDLSKAKFGTHWQQCYRP